MGRGKPLTKEEFIKRAYEKNEHIRNGEIEIRGEFTGTKEPIECFCTIHNVLWNPRPNDLWKGIECKQCGSAKTADKRRVDVDTINRQLEQMNNDIKMIGKCFGVRAETEFQCSLNHIWRDRPIDILNGKGCPYCNGHRVWVGFNDLWTTRPDVAKLLLNSNDGYKYTYGSNKKLEFICPICGSIIIKSVKEACQNGLVCQLCSDGISYPNKFSRLLLAQLSVENVKYEWDPDWVKPYSYDNYFEYCGKAYILEFDGGLGHGKKKYKSNERDVVGKERDIYKDRLAEKHNIKVIRIDCDYTGKRDDRFMYIKNNILQSELCSIFDLSCVDWEYCDCNAQKTLIKQVVDLYNQGLSVSEIQKIVGYYINTIRRWLTTAAKYNLCNYNRKESRRRTDDSIYRHINQYSINGEFMRTYKCIAEASEVTGVDDSSIYGCCKHYSGHKTAGGFLWFYTIDTDQPDQTKIILTIQN